MPNIGPRYCPKCNKLLQQKRIVIQEDEFFCDTHGQIWFDERALTTLLLIPNDIDAGIKHFIKFYGRKIPSDVWEINIFRGGDDKFHFRIERVNEEDIKKLRKTVLPNSPENFHCDECNLDFPTEKSLKAHLVNAAQHNIKECVCQTCGKGFHNIKSRNRHQKACKGVIKSLIQDGLIEEVGK